VVERIDAVDVDDLIVLIAGRLSAIVPAGFRIEAADGKLWYSAVAGQSPAEPGRQRVCGARTNVRRAFDRRGEITEDHIIDAAVRVLKDLQDYIQEAGQDPWPATSRPPRARAEVRDSMLYLWYGEPGEVVLGCDPIPLGGMRSAQRQAADRDASNQKWAESVGNVASPLLAGFSLATVVVVAGDPQKFYWAGAAIVSLTYAAITLIAAVQSSKYVHGGEAHAEGWYRGTRVLYHSGILALLLGLGFALVPGSAEWPRRVACGMALAAAAGEAIFFGREAASDAHAAISFFRRWWYSRQRGRLAPTRDDGGSHP
jgi:hypothetical protein